MGVKNVGEKYRCNICGNEVVVTEVGGGTLVCCGEEMELIGEEEIEEDLGEEDLEDLGDEELGDEELEEEF